MAAGRRRVTRRERLGLVENPNGDGVAPLATVVLAIPPPNPFFEIALP
jgi:hypothetical protein